MNRQINKDVLRLIALELDYPDLLNFCKTYTVCDNVFWRNKFIKDFVFSNTQKYNSPEGLLKYKLNWKHTYEIFKYEMRKMIYIDNRAISIYDLPSYSGIEVYITIISNFNAYKTLINYSEEVALNDTYKEIEQELKQQFIDYRKAFMIYYGETPEEKFGGSLEKILNKYKKRIESKGEIEIDLPFPENTKYEIVKYVY